MHLVPSKASKLTMVNSGTWLDKNNSSSTVSRMVTLIRNPTLTTAARRQASCVRQVGNRLLCRLHVIPHAATAVLHLQRTRRATSAAEEGASLTCRSTNTSWQGRSALRHVLADAICARISAIVRRSHGHLMACACVRLRTKLQVHARMLHVPELVARRRS